MATPFSSAYVESLIQGVSRGYNAVALPFSVFATVSSLLKATSPMNFYCIGEAPGWHILSSLCLFEIYGASVAVTVPPATFITSVGLDFTFALVFVNP